jgi:hypothetical protein
MSLLALPWFVLTTTGSPTLTGLVATVELTPYVTVQAVGGPAVDRLGAWRTAIACDVGAGVLVGLVPLLHVLGLLTTAQLLVLVALAGGLRGAGDAGREVMLPGVGDHAGTPVERAAGLYDGVNRGAGLVGAPLAGVLIGLTNAVNAAAWAGMPIGGLLAGMLVESAGLRPTLVLGAAVYFATTLAPFVFPAWRGMDEPVPERPTEMAAAR